MVYFCWAIANPRNLILGFRESLGFALRKEAKPLKLKDWLGGLDSNQDSQLQRLMYYRLYDLPTASSKTSYKFDVSGLASKLDQTNHRATYRFFFTGLRAALTSARFFLRYSPTVRPRLSNHPWT